MALTSMALIPLTLLNPPAANAGEMRGDVELTPLNSLAFNYRESTSAASPTPADEFSIDYSEFLTFLDNGYVDSVDFIAPNGDKAYATITVPGEKGFTKRVLIGKGYPREDPKGWSSPAFVVRSVKDKNVPYKFIVPELEKFRQ